jgi:DNA polymerase/3'-5' exonuclease PolX
MVLGFPQKKKKKNQNQKLKEPTHQFQIYTQPFYYICRLFCVEKERTVHYYYYYTGGDHHWLRKAMARYSEKHT